MEIVSGFDNFQKMMQLMVIFHTHSGEKAGWNKGQRVTGGRPNPAGYVFLPVNLPLGRRVHLQNNARISPLPDWWQAG